ncbi:Aste57867_13324 [Aphanomyces stellatus]|uniref:Aste57867_13324 protein n=1 Tax=Aphanomyces stellatus TaxID=120398 RepID=A0A485KYC0_9STRA|nr:hypothetical protein As57867_013275 [Aphanomyces stellatus]VFT90163.1 Aste57867_13324 [Aphanomyces stellatus]
MEGSSREKPAPPPKSSASPHPSSHAPLLIVSNQLPMRLQKDADGVYVATWCGDRLLASSMAFSHQDLFRSSRRKMRFLGRVEMDVPVEDHEAVTQACAAVSCIPVFPTSTDDSAAFDRFCKGTLRAVFHNMVHPSTLNVHVLPTLDYPQRLNDARQAIDDMDTAWASFLNVSKDIAAVISAVHVPGEIFWLQDYEVTLVPYFLARTNLRHVPTGLFLHVPFPSKQALATLSFKTDLLRSMLLVHHIGFHLYEHARHFVDACESILHLPSPSMQQGQLVVDNNGKRISLTCAQLTIDPARVEKELASNAVRDDVIRWRQLFPHKLIFASCDVVDVLHGLPQKCMALHQFLQKNADFATRVLLIQVGIVTTTLGSKIHAEAVRQLVDEINAQYDDPVISFEVREERMTFAERVALWRVAEVFVSTVFAEGLNTCPFEYIAAHRNATGIAVLSENAVASRVLHGAAVVNPWNVAQIAEAMDAAVHMSLKEKEFRRDCDIVSIVAHTSLRWATTILTDITAASHVSPRKLEAMTKPLTDVTLLDMYRKSRGRRIFFFDYYRTLAPDVMSDFGIVWPDVPVDVLSSLEQLCRDQRNTVFVVSGCNCELLSDKFGSVPGLGLVAEHGYFIRWAKLGHAARMEKPWELYGDVFRVNATCGKWREKAEGVMQAYVDRTNGAALEMRRSSILFRYAGADFKFGMMQARELYLHLTAAFEGWPLSVIQGKDYIEVRPEGLGKGKIVSQILNKLHKDSTAPIDFVWTMGDDVADELMFDAAQSCADAMSIPQVLTCTVGHKDSKAKYYVSDHAQVVSLLASVRLALTKESRYHSVADMQSILAKHVHHVPQVAYNSATLPVDSVTRKNSSKALRHCGLAPVMEEEHKTIELPEMVSSIIPPKRHRTTWLTVVAVAVVCGLIYRARRGWTRLIAATMKLAKWKWGLGMLAFSCGVWWQRRGLGAKRINGG